MDAFEGYAYDAGVRIGDGIVAVGGEDATKMTVDQVCTCPIICMYV